MLPSQIPEFESYPIVRSFMASHVDMQFNDVRGMLKLPLPCAGIDAGCNFPAASTLCNLIAGISMKLYTPTKPKLDSGKKFKKLLGEFYPWQPEDDENGTPDVIYNFFRTPLTHYLATNKSGSGEMRITKEALSENQITEIERSRVRPPWVPPAVIKSSPGYTLSVWGLYWGVFHLVERLSRDVNQMQLAENRLSGGG